jgi:hypothetical protein
MAVLVVTVRSEGGLYCPDKNPASPIRIYSDRRVQDNFYTACVGRLGGVPRKWRERLTRKEYRHVRKAATANRQRGEV